MFNKKQLILVTGSHRSGTTWVGKTISQHSDIRYIHEPFNAEYPHKLLKLNIDTNFLDVETCNEQHDILNGINRYVKWRPFIHAYKDSRPRGIELATPYQVMKCFFTEAFLTPRILIKDPLALMSAAWLHHTYGCQVICMIRNPYAFIGSLKIKGWDFDFNNLFRQKTLVFGRLSDFSETIELYCKNTHNSDFIDRAILLWNILHSVILQYQKQYPNWLYIRHEDISERPHHGFQQAFDYLGLEMNTEVKQYIDQYTSDKNPIDINTLYQPRSSKQILHTWKERLTDEEIARIHTATKATATQFYDEFS